MDSDGIIEVSEKSAERDFDRGESDALGPLWSSVFSRICRLKTVVLDLRSSDDYEEILKPLENLPEWDHSLRTGSSSSALVPDSDPSKVLPDEEKQPVLLDDQVPRETGIQTDQLLAVDEDAERIKRLLKEKEADVNVLQTVVDSLSDELSATAAVSQRMLSANADLETQIKHLQEALQKMTDRQHADVSIQCDKREKQQPWIPETSGLRRAESLGSVRDFTRIISQKDREILRLKSAAERSSQLEQLVMDLRMQLARRSSQLDSLQNLFEQAVEQVRPGPSVSLTNGRYLSGSRTSLRSDVNSMEDEPDLELNTTDIPRRSSWRGSHASVTSKPGSVAFRYKEDTPTRLEELERRNKAQMPHLRSVYPVEQTADSWRHPDEDPVETVQNTTDDLVRDAPEKRGLLQKLQSTLHLTSKKSRSYKAKNRGSKENISYSDQPLPHNTVDMKPVAFTITLSPKKKKKKPKKIFQNLHTCHSFLGWISALLFTELKEKDQWHLPLLAVLNWDARTSAVVELGCGQSVWFLRRNHTLWYGVGLSTPTARALETFLDRFCYVANILPGEENSERLLTFYDLSGSPKLLTGRAAVYSNGFRHITGVILVFDISDRKSFETLDIWHRELNLVFPLQNKNFIKILVGNKLDKQTLCAPMQEMEEWAERNEFRICLTAARDGRGVAEICPFILKMLDTISDERGQDSGDAAACSQNIMADQVFSIYRIMNGENDWERLGVPSGSNGNQITKAYRRVAAQIHPDKCPLNGSEEAFKLLTSSKDSLVAPNFLK